MILVLYARAIKLLKKSSISPELMRTIFKITLDILAKIFVKDSEEKSLEECRKEFMGMDVAINLAKKTEAMMVVLQESSSHILEEGEELYDKEENEENEEKSSASSPSLLKQITLKGSTLSHVEEEDKQPKKTKDQFSMDIEEKQHTLHHVETKVQQQGTYKSKPEAQIILEKAKIMLERAADLEAEVLKRRLAMREYEDDYSDTDEADWSSDSDSSDYSPTTPGLGG